MNFNYVNYLSSDKFTETEFCCTLLMESVIYVVFRKDDIKLRDHVILVKTRKERINKHGSKYD